MVAEFQRRFRQRLNRFYQALQQLSNQPINPNAPRSVSSARRDRWSEAVDANCRIVVCSGDAQFGKPYALAVLHSEELKTKDRQDRIVYDGNLCGSVSGTVKPSPVWILDLGDYQVVTIFGATQNPRKQYLKKLGRKEQDFHNIWPL